MVASFCKRLNTSTEDNDVIRANIQVYDMKLNKRTFKFESSYDGGSFENYIFILEAHPYNESILMSADYDGKVLYLILNFTESTFNRSLFGILNVAKCLISS